MESPERMRNNRVLEEMEEKSFTDPTIITMTKEKNSTTMVLRAVATVESVFFIPHLANMEVRPAKKAERKANSTHMISSTSIYSTTNSLFPHPYSKGRKANV